MSGSLRGLPIGRDPIWLAAKLPTEIIAYTVALATADQLVLANLTAQVAPSGAGEVTISALTFSGGNAVLTLAGGQATRSYTLLLTANLSTGLRSDYLLRLNVAPVLSTDQATAPPSSGFGSASTWTYAPSMNFSRPRNTMMIL